MYQHNINHPANKEAVVKVIVIMLKDKVILPYGVVMSSYEYWAGYSKMYFVYNSFLKCDINPQSYNTIKEYILKFIIKYKWTILQASSNLHTL